MKISDLISQLQALPQESEILVFVKEYGDFVPIENAMYAKEDGIYHIILKD